MEFNNGPNIVRITVPFHPGKGMGRGKATCTAYRNFWRCASSTENERGRINEGVEEGLRDYRREQSAKKMRVHLFFIRENTH